MISGGYPSSSVGKSVEVFVPSTGQHCTLPDLPTWTYGHTMEGMMLCGGVANRSSCLTLTEDGWKTTTTLLKER